ncbi:aldo/keto reductase [Acuticoccus yangtzensis]|uniref:aldo/keto reductase n=1 Tax=Acuticoccus yangtzensis TaxID=1443441 RepID=UPI000949ADB2|nr:aldo/keto reductase [Acuticoccus yangtzensis]ORE93730.1 oxidoreductase, aldo/keto reductase family protein [Stappia sp. 22II-S9-Z10]
MDYRKLGRTDLAVSVLTLGTMTWGRQNTPDEAFAQMDRAVDAGINMFDNAEMYPVPPAAETRFRCEEIMGDWFASRKARDKVMIATKVAGRSQMTWLREDGHAPKLVARDINEAVDGSLRRLKTDYIDLYQVHWPDRNVSQFGSNPTVYSEPDKAADETPIAETLEALGALVKAGKVRHIGLSNESTWGVMKYLHAAEMHGLPRVASIQNAYSLLNRTFEVNLAEACTREDVSLLCYSALAQGYLTGKYRNGALPEGARKTLFNRLQRYEGPGATELNDTYLDLAAEFGLDPAQMAIAFAASRPFMTSVIIGQTSVEQLDTVLGSLDVTLPEELLTRIDTLHRARGNVAP